MAALGVDEHCVSAEHRLFKVMILRPEKLQRVRIIEDKQDGGIPLLARLLDLLAAAIDPLSDKVANGGAVDDSMVPWLVRGDFLDLKDDFSPSNRHNVIGRLFGPVGIGRKGMP